MVGVGEQALEKLHVDGAREDELLDHGMSQVGVDVIQSDASAKAAGGVPDGSVTAWAVDGKCDWS